MIAIALCLVTSAGPPSLSEAFKKIVRHGETLAAAEGKQVTIDEKNAFVELEGAVDGVHTTTTFTFFVTRAKERVYGYRYSQDSLKGFTLDVGFFRLENDKVVNVTSDVLPSLPNFWPEAFFYAQEYCAGPDIDLPRKGTTIVLHAVKNGWCAPGGPDSQDKQRAFGAAVEALSRRYRWDPKQGVFLVAR